MTEEPRKVEYYDGSDSPPDLVVYHGNCFDGFTAAWAVRQKHQNATPWAAGYGQDLPPEHLWEGKHVLIVDFSYPGPQLLEMASKAKSVTVLDHHVSAMRDLCHLLKERVIQGEFDMDKSGARLAWEYTWGTGVASPVLIDMVEDRDLWLKRIEGTDALSAYLGAEDMVFERWTEIARKLENPGSRQAILAEGAAIRRSHEKLIEGIISQTQRSMIIGGIEVPVACVPYAFASDAGNLLSRDWIFAATYVDRGDGKRQFSLRRSIGDVDVSEIAKLYGGGGHAAAAGFTAEKGWEGDLDEGWPLQQALNGLFGREPDAMPLKRGAGGVKV